MTTEKRKRTKKPKMTAAIEAVRAALPFLNYGRKGMFDDKELFRLSLPVFHRFYPMLKWDKNYPKPEEEEMRRVLKDTGHPVGKDETDTAFWLGWAGHEKAAAHLSETWRGCSEMLDHLVDGNVQWLNLKWIDEAFRAFRFHLGGIIPIKFEVVAFPTEEEKDGFPKGSNLPGFRANMVRARIAPGRFPRPDGTTNQPKVSAVTCSAVARERRSGHRQKVTVRPISD